jgi:uncharacterized protein
MVHRIPETGAFYELRLTAEQLGECFVERPDITRVGEGGARLHARRVGRLVDLRGEARADIRFVCGRCGDEFDAALTSPVRMALSPRPDTEGGLDEDEGVGFYEGDEIDFDAVVREQLALAAPSAFLCRPHCRGVCSTCGANLNDGPCRCGPRKME